MFITSGVYAAALYCRERSSVTQGASSASCLMVSTMCAMAVSSTKILAVAAVTSPKTGPTSIRAKHSLDAPRGGAMPQ